jgi:hypothetical protein
MKNALEHKELNIAFKTVWSGMDLATQAATLCDSLGQTASCASRNFIHQREFSNAQRHATA